MKEVLISIRPSWIELIVAGEKTIECRKSCPRCILPFTVYLYETRASWMFTFLRNLGWDVFADKLESGRGKVVGEFTCTKISCTDPPFTNMGEAILKASCLTAEQLENYSAGKRLFFWHISDLVIYDEPKPLSDFYVVCQKPYCTTNCKRYSTCGATADWEYQITRPPQSWCYVEGPSQSERKI